MCSTAIVCHTSDVAIKARRSDFLVAPPPPLLHRWPVEVVNPGGPSLGSLEAGGAVLVTD